MTPELARRVAAVAAESRAGASALLRRAVPILQAAQREDQAVLESVALALCAAQSSMASLWNAVALALRQDDGVGLSRYAERARRSPAILGRFAVAVLTSGDAPATPLAVATVSASGSVRQCLQELSRRCELHVVCAESRPLYEGRQLAAELTADSIATTVCTDAAVGGFLELVDAVLVGADAISSSWFINKCGSRQVVATAAEIGVPVYLVGGRDKFIAPPLDEMLQLGVGPAGEVWAVPPDGVTVANPYFERVPMEGVTSVITDAGMVGAGSVPDICGSVVPEGDVERLVKLLMY